MKKTLVTTLIFAMVLGTVGCGTKKTEPAENPVVEEGTVEEETVEKPEEPVEEVELVKEEETENITLGNKLADKFTELANIENTSTLEIAKGVAESVEEMEIEAFDIQAGFLNGFDDEISEFNHATMFGPMISAIPFVGYVFETDDTVALVEKLDKTHDLNWNICTSADEAVSKVVGNYVFFVMCPTAIEPAEAPEVDEEALFEEALPTELIFVDENGNIIEDPESYGNGNAGGVPSPDDSAVIEDDIEMNNEG